MMLRWPALLTVAQILWIHLICDGPSDIVLGFEPGEEGIMDEPPRPKNAPILTRLGYTLIGMISIASSFFALLIFNYYATVYNNPVAGRSMVFASFAVNSMVYIFAYRSLQKPLWQMAPLKENPWLVWSVIAGLTTALIAFLVPGLRTVLGIVPLSLGEWGVIMGIALLLLAIVEIVKLIANRLYPSEAE